MRAMLRAVFIAAVAGALTLAGISPASAHQHRRVGNLNTTVGWLEEPAFAGFRNAVQFVVERRVDAADGAEARPVTDAELGVEVIFGDRDGTQRTEPMDLRPAFGRPGEYRAFIIPTRPGTYTFRIFGTIGQRAFEEFYTSGEAGADDRSEGTYDDVRAPSDAQFPTDDAAELAAALAEARDIAASADSAAGAARVLAIVAIALAALGLLGGMTLGRTRG